MRDGREAWAGIGRGASQDVRGGLSRRELLGGVSAAALAAGAGGLLTACSGSAPVAATAPRKRRGGDLVAGLLGGGGSDTVDPQRPLTYLDTLRAAALCEPLLDVDSFGRPRPRLAEEIIPDKSLTEWVVRLRDGVHFHSGKPLTSGDVLYSFTRIYRGDLPGKIFLGPIDITETKAVDRRTLRVRMTAPFGVWDEHIAAAWFNLVIAPEGFDPKQPDGTGPFVFKSFTPGERSVFARNPSYWESGLPYVDTLTIQDFSDANALLDGLRTGVVHCAGMLEPAQVATLQTTAGIRAVVSPSGAFLPFTMRVDQPPFDDVNVRQALRLLVNRTEMVNSALDGRGRIASDVFSPYDPDYDAALRRPASGDIPQAKFLLEKAGKENLRVNLVTSDIAASTVAMATVLAEQAQVAGVTINIQKVPPETFFGPNYLKWTFAQDYYVSFPYLAQVGACMLKGSPFNETHYADDQYARLYQEACGTADVARRRAIVEEMQRMDFSRGSYIIPAFEDTIDGYSNRVTGDVQAQSGLPISGGNLANLAFVD